MSHRAAYFVTERPCRQLFRQCRTPNRHNYIHIVFEKRIQWVSFSTQDRGITPCIMSIVCHGCWSYLVAQLRLCSRPASDNKPCLSEAFSSGFYSNLLLCLSYSISNAISGSSPFYSFCFFVDVHDIHTGAHRREEPQHSTFEDLFHQCQAQYALPNIVCQLCL